MQWYHQHKEKGTQEHPFRKFPSDEIRLLFNGKTRGKTIPISIQ